MEVREFLKMRLSPKNKEDLRIATAGDGLLGPHEDRQADSYLVYETLATIPGAIEALRVAFERRAEAQLEREGCARCRGKAVVDA